MPLLKLNPPTEAEEQEAFFKAVYLHEAKYPELQLVYMNPNGAYLGADRQRYGAKLKLQGLRPGVPDIFCAVMRWQICPICESKREKSWWNCDRCEGTGSISIGGLYIEMKRTNYKPSDTPAHHRESQQAMQDKLRAQGYKVEVCKGWREAWGVLCDYLGLPEEVRVK